MHRRLEPMIVLFAVIGLAILLVLVTSISSLAHGAVAEPITGLPLQELTPTPEQVDASVAGSTDGIVWMGILITLIVLVPILIHRALWTRQT